MSAPAIDPEREATLERMAHACADHLSRADAMCVAYAALRESEAFVAYLATDNGPFTDREFAMHALRCARRVRDAGGRHD